MFRQITAEFLGTALLLISVIGSGIAGQTLANGNIAIALLANAAATGCMLYVIITCLGPISGAHFNPIVSLSFWLRGELPLQMFVGFVAAQVVGGTMGVWLTHVMYDLPVIQFATNARTGAALWVSECVATLGLLFVIFGGLKSKPHVVPTLVAIYIAGAYWFTSSTSFANPAVTFARMFSDTFAGIAPEHVIAFVICQIAGALIAFPALRWLFKDT